MPVYKHEYPILEHDTDPTAIVSWDSKDGDFPRQSVITFFGGVLRDYAHKNSLPEIGVYLSEMGRFPIYMACHQGVEIALAQGVVGSASIAMLTEHLIKGGCRNLIACGGCGVLEDLPLGHVIVPVIALRDEGASYHYLPPARTIDLDGDVLAVIRRTLSTRQQPYTEAKVWTTDAFYRETRDMVEYRRQEGCGAVDMECATMAAVARFRQARFGQLLYAGDTLADPDFYDERGWMRHETARQHLFHLALDCAAGLAEMN